ncbi:MAG: hypothetical protein WCB68_19930 [Pyrinomonadaceae bacterium]
MKLFAVTTLILLSGACSAFAQRDSSPSSDHSCQVGVIDFKSKRAVKTLEFSPVIGEEERTDRTFEIPGTDAKVIASVFYTDESMASTSGSDSMRLGVAVSKRAWPHAFAAPNNAVAEVTLATFDTAQVYTNVYVNGKHLLVLMECRDKSKQKPVSSAVEPARAVVVQSASTPATVTAVVVNEPLPIPQNEVSVPQRPVSPLEARGPGSVVVKPSRPVDVLLASKTIYVASRTNFFKPEQLINELKKRAEIDSWGLSFVDDEKVADLVLTLDHVVFTYKFTFTLSHQRTGVVVATGSRIIWDGNLGAAEMAKRVIEKLAQVRAQTPTRAGAGE